MFLIIFRYDGNLLNENNFSESISEGFKNEDFRNLTTWLVNEISDLAKMDEKVRMTKLPEYDKISSDHHHELFPDHQGFRRQQLHH